MGRKEERKTQYENSEVKRESLELHEFIVPACPGVALIFYLPDACQDIYVLHLYLRDMGGKTYETVI